MSTTLFFQIFLVIDVFIMGVLATYAFGHAREHYKTTKSEPDKPQLPVAVKERMIRNTQTEFQTVLNHSVENLERDLESSSEQINDLIKRFAGEIVNDELERYRTELSKLHKQAETDMGNIRQEVANHQQDFEAKISQEVDLEKQKLIKQIDTKLGDAVSSFLFETLGHNVDLGSQGDYLVGLLEEHKAEFVQEVSGGD